MLNEQSTKTVFRGNRLADGTEPSDPTLIRRAGELLLHLQSLSAHQFNIRNKLFGVGPECAADPSGQKDRVEPPLADLLAMACERAALLVGEAATIQERL